MLALFWSITCRKVIVFDIAWPFWSKPLPHNCCTSTRNRNGTLRGSHCAWGVRGFCILFTRPEFCPYLLFRNNSTGLKTRSIFNLQGHLHRDKVRTLLGSIWSGLERCPIRILKDEASLLPRLSVARDPVENGLFFVGLCDCVKERIPYTGI